MEEVRWVGQLKYAVFSISESVHSNFKKMALFSRKVKKRQKRGTLVEFFSTLGRLFVEIPVGFNGELGCCLLYTSDAADE